MECLFAAILAQFKKSVICRAMPKGKGKSTYNGKRTDDGKGKSMDAYRRRAHHGAGKNKDTSNGHHGKDQGTSTGYDGKGTHDNKYTIMKTQWLTKESIERAMALEGIHGTVTTSQMTSQMTLTVTTSHGYDQINAPLRRNLDNLHTTGPTNFQLLSVAEAPTQAYVVTAAPTQEYVVPVHCDNCHFRCVNAEMNAREKYCVYCRSSECPDCKLISFAPRSSWPNAIRMCTKCPSSPWQ
jgi:hypothetical protein